MAKKAALAITTLAGCAISMASLVVASAAADSPDSQFLGKVRSINNAGLATLVDAAPTVVTKAGRSVCTMLDDGYGFQAVTGNVLDQLAMYGENRDYYAGLFGVYAVSAYCPEHQADSGFNGNY